jgi:hypothetical protein
MNRTFKRVLLVIGLLLMAYGIYAMIIPETKVAIGNLKLVEKQENTNAYIFMGLGVIAVLLSFLKGKKIS